MRIARGPWPSRDRRRDEVARRLAALGPGPAFPRPVDAAAADAPAIRLAAALPELGPVFAAFGRYLSARIDLLPESSCRALEAVRDRRPPLAPEGVAELLRRALGRPLEAAYAEFDPLAVISTLAGQEHRARLADGTAVRVRLARPEFEPELAADLELLPLLGPALGAAGMDPARLGEAVSGFAAALAAACDLGRQAAALVLLAEDGAAGGLGLTAPRVVPELSAAGVLTVEEVAGVPLDAVAGPGADEIGTRLCQAWLRQALRGRAFPVDFGPGDVVVLADRRIAWTGGVLDALPPAGRDALWEYLAAAAAHDPDRACAALLREMEPRAEDPARLARRVRQLVPFRDGGWQSRDDLAGYLFLHWRTAAEEGWRPRPHLVGFYRGLYRLAVEARRLDPARDLLREGFEAARLAAGLGDVAGLFGREQAQEVLGSYAAALLAMPQRFNELLTLLAEGRASVRVEVVEPPPESRRRDRSAADLAVLLAMAAVALLAHDLAAAGDFGPWPERFGVLLLGLLGGLLVRGRRRRR